jgi:putative NADPH-quinone reductase
MERVISFIRREGKIDGFFAVILATYLSMSFDNKANAVESVMKKIAFLNASRNREGNTANLAARTLAGLKYKSVNLVDFHLDQSGQESKGDEFSKVFGQVSHIDVLVIGTPVYWSDMTGYLKTFIDRLPNPDELSSKDHPLKDTDVYLIVQGTAPEDAFPGITNVIEHVCRRYFMNYKGLIRNQLEADSVNKTLK